MQKLGGTYKLAGEFEIHRMGYGAMRLSGPGIYGPPRNRAQAADVLRAAVEGGVNHIDTSDFYGPHFTNQLIRETLHPYPDGLVLVTKVGARRTPDRGWHEATTPAELRSAVEDNLRNLAVDVLDVVNLRLFTGQAPPSAAPIEDKLEVLLELQHEGKIKHIGLSNIVASQLEEALTLGPVACVQNSYGVLNRADDPLVDLCGQRGIAFVPFFPLGGFQPYKSEKLDRVAAEVGATSMQVALAWLLHRAPHLLLIPGTSSVAHLKENLAAADLTLSEEQMQRLDA